MDIVYAKANTQVHYQGVPRSVIVGQHWPASDPVVQQYPDLFTTDPRFGLTATVEPPSERLASARERPVEQATAAPGEKRSSASRA